MMKFLKSAIDLTETTAKLVTEPARIVMDTASILVKPIAKTAEDMADEFEETKKEITE